MSELHRATVLDAHDPEGELRLKVMVPGVLGDRSVWAWPLVGGRGLQTPATGAGVFVLFEQDDVDRPLWMVPR